MVLTPNQRRALQLLPPNQRANRARQFNQQNSQRNPAVRPAASILVTQRRLNSPAQPSLPRTINSNFQSNLPSGTIRVTGTSVFHPVTTHGTKTQYKHSSINIKPSNIPSLVAYTNLYASWSYQNITFTYTPSAPDSEPGFFFYSVTPQSKPDAADSKAAYALHQVRINSIHKPVAPIRVSLPPVPNTFFHTVKSFDYDFKLQFGTDLTNADVTAGIIHVTYNILFRDPQ